MKIDKRILRQRLLDYNAGTISESEHLKFWDDLQEICAYQIKKSKNDKMYYDFIQDMVIYVIDHYLKNFTVYTEDGRENSALAFLLQSAYFAKLVLWNNKYKHESNEFLTMNVASADSEGNSDEIVNTWSNEAYSDIWERAWGKSLPYQQRKKKKKKNKDGTEEEVEEEEVEEEVDDIDGEEVETTETKDEDLYDIKCASICNSFVDEEDMLDEQ
jgi:hypothetical protein